MFRFLFVLACIIAVASAIKLTPGGPKKSSSPAVKKASTAVASKPVGKISKKFGKDMTWGGRPDPTPEIVVAGAAVPFASEFYTPKAADSLGGFLEAPWRYNLRKD